MAEIETLIDICKQMPVLKKGMGIFNKGILTSDEIANVLRVQLELFNEGCISEDNAFWDSPEAKGFKFGDPRAILVWLDGDFGKWTEDAVKDFQCRHLDSDGLFLESDGVVGPKTWVALYSLRSDRKVVDQVVPIISTDSSSERVRVLDTAFKYLGAAEVPRGSNRGPIVDLFTNKRALAWCAAFTHYVYKEATGGKYYTNSDNKLSVYYNRQWAIENKIFIFKGKGDPIPGDIFSINYGSGGHTGFVTGVKRDAAGKVIGIFTLAGNEDNQVQEGYRPLSSSSLLGYIRPYKAEDVITTYTKTNTNAVDVSGDKTR